MEKLVLRRQRSRQNGNNYRIRVSSEIYGLIETISDKTNMTQTEVANRMIEFAGVHLEIKED